jgi:hypothetical protein
MKDSVKEQEIILEKLKLAHDLIEKEKRDIQAMHDHNRSEPNSKKDKEILQYANPLQADVDDEE